MDATLGRLHAALAAGGEGVTTSLAKKRIGRQVDKKGENCEEPANIL